MSRSTFIHSVIHGRKPWPNGVRRYRAESLNAIIHDTASKHGLTFDHLVSKGRTADIAEARHEAVLRAHETGKYSLSQIGRAFGGRDHTTILNSIKRGRELRARHD